MPDKNYKNLNEWLNEIEVYSTRQERLLETVDLSDDQWVKLLPFLKAIFEAGSER